MNACLHSWVGDDRCPYCLLDRSIEPLADQLNDLENARALYDGYPRRQERFDAAIMVLGGLLDDIRNCVRRS